MLLYVLDLLGVAVFAASGTIAGMLVGLDLFGILVLSAMTAIGGGTIRDVLLGRYPVFWIKDNGPLLTILAATALTVGWVQYFPTPRGALLVADAFGLALFAISGAQVAERENCRPLVVIVMGTLTGAGGGVVRDVLGNKVPLILRQDIYATAAIAGIALYLLLRALKVPTAGAFIVGVVAVAAIRLASIAYDLHLPVVGSQP